MRVPTAFETEEEDAEPACTETACTDMTPRRGARAGRYSAGGTATFGYSPFGGGGFGGFEEAPVERSRYGAMSAKARNRTTTFLEPVMSQEEAICEGGTAPLEGSETYDDAGSETCGGETQQQLEEEEEEETDLGGADVWPGGTQLEQGVLDEVWPGCTQQLSGGEQMLESPADDSLAGATP